ncbi:MAG: TVP38/TMEM64 family protein [Clostridia bacterium]|nr:TVP38/TMEM64 family protein [Clostridia bacterium]
MISHKKAAAAVGIVLSVLIAAAVTLAVFRPFVSTLSEPEKFAEWVEGYGIWGKLIYSAAVVWQIIVPVLPGELFEIAAGYAFGAVRGTLWCMAAEAAGSVAVLLLTRRFGQPLLEIFFKKEKIESSRFLTGSKRKALLFSLLFVLPGTPKDLMCYYAGLTGLPLPLLLAVCTLGRFPAVVTSTLGGAGLGSRRYLFAVIVFAVTAIVSLAGVLLYSKLTGKKK